MPLDDRWSRFERKDWEALARSWLSELGGTSDPKERKFGQAVVMMNFTATPAQQWEFILAAMSQAETEQELGHIAAGPVEHLLGWHGEQYIDEFERQVASDSKFVRLLAGLRKYRIKDEVWARVQALKGEF